MSRDLRSFYILVELQLLGILGLHALVQPYKRKWHNKLDTCIFSTLLFINTCTLYNYHRRRDAHDASPLSSASVIAVTTTLQVVAAALPLVYAGGYLAVRVLRMLRVKAKEWREKRRNGGGGGGGGEGGGGEGGVDPLLEVEMNSREERECSNLDYNQFQGESILISL